MLENAYKIFTDAEEISYISDYYRYRSIYELQSNNLDTALEYCNKSISAAMESRNDMKKLKALRLKGIILANMGDYAEALQMYEESIQLALQLESDYEAAKGFYRRHSLFYVLKRYEEARQDLEEARKAIGRIDKCRWTQIIQQSNCLN
ncbi:tetratricopeptide repeat protein [Thermoanaerobacter pentosaceus]|uniref:Tetratricopeptide (TPR) repeat protein n=1 Tax=Thermoanaerobacter pentosaceus TaxID=694059 RepID=A0ABT9M5S4_9THEO|nr:tetratricopeptide repeat protein [Thermoanaerobacter pentosaceus]MDP9751482.1 tetratricopeptide (TPR) repeat protein [Thermoanaerobacter pentosaceus]